MLTIAWFRQGDHVEGALNWILANGELLAMEDSAREARAAGGGCLHTEASIFLLLAQ